MKVGVYTNLFKDTDFEVTSTLIVLLKKHNVDFYLYKNLKERFCLEKSFDEFDYHKLDLMITVGGDGTVLNIAKNCVNSDIPMLPINKGTKGFLNEIELDSIERVIDVINGDYKEDKRILISVSLKGRSYFALNEAYVTRKSSGKMIRLNSMIDSRLVDKYFCDGLLVCTPTGSTAYSLSVGGPVISPNASVMCLTPVSSHCLRSRPIVVGDDEQIEIGLENDCDDAVLMVDGVTVDEIGLTDRVVIKKSEKHIRFFRLKESVFYSKLLDKLNGLV